MDGWMDGCTSGWNRWDGWFGSNVNNVMEGDRMEDFYGVYKRKEMDGWINGWRIEMDGWTDGRKDGWM